MKYSFFSILFLFSLTFISCTKEEESVNIISVSGDQDEDSTSSTIDDNYRYQIPVIFHVLYSNANDTNQYVPYNRIKEILQNVNELWEGDNFYIKEYGVGQDMGVDFVLAETDESGNILSQPGVEYIKYTDEYPIDPQTFMSAKDNKKYMWEPNEFLNVMLYNFKADASTGSTVLGISHLPYSVSGSTALEGLSTTTKGSLSKSNLNFCYCSSINSLYQSKKYEDTRYSYYDNSNTNYMYYKSTDINSTVAHEFGHYLGLFHVFAEDHSAEDFQTLESSDDTDFCDDTESYNYIAYQDTLSWLAGRRDYTMDDAAMRYDGNRHKHYTATNIMDYWACFCNRFTEEQRARVRHVLYYSPLIPGPKLSTAAQAKAIGRAKTEDEILPNARIIE